MQTFNKAERLSSKIAIDALFATGESFYSKPFKIYWLPVNESEHPVKLVISVPKRIFKRAVDRNKLKRLIREAYRKNKTVLYDELGAKHIHMMFIYTSHKIIDYSEVEEKLKAGLQLFVKKIN